MPRPPPGPLSAPLPARPPTRPDRRPQRRAPDRGAPTPRGRSRTPGRGRPSTLRTWDRRYGIGPTDHAPGRHRRYSPDDLARLELMHRALIQGATPADAAVHAL